MDLDKLQLVKEKYDLWWEGKNEEPLFHMIFPKGEADFSPVVKDWMSPHLYKRWSNWQQEFVFGQGVELTWKTGDWRYVDEALDFLEFYAGVTDHAAEGFPFLLPCLGPGVLAAFITNFTQFHDNTIWFEVPEPWGWNKLSAIDENTRSPYAEVALPAVRRLTERLSDKFVISGPDIGGILDALAAIRGTNNLLLDTLDCPENILSVLAVLEKLFYRYHEEMSAIISPANHGCYVKTMRYLSGKPTHISVCDFCAMISPDAFRELVLPCIERECEYFNGRVVYHMDGPGQIAHMDMLCGIEKLHAIQWVSGAGNPGALSDRWDDLYRRILDAGKKICLAGSPKNPDEMRRFFKKFPKQAFFVPFVLNNREEAEALLNAR